MSYITALQPTRSAATSTETSRAFMPKRGVDAHAGPPAGLPGRLSGSLEVMLLLSTLSGLSLVLCIIAAGAF